MKITKFKIVLVGVVILLCSLMGCEGLFQEVVDPNSGLNVGVDITSEIIPAIAIGATTAIATGLPWAAIVLLVTNVASVIVGVYKNYRKNIIIGEQDSLYINTKETTKAIIEAIEDVGGITTPGATGGDTIGDVVKNKIEEKLKSKDYYLVGKAIITALKGD